MRKKGMSLIEVVVSMLILSVTLVLFATCLKMFYKSRIIRQEREVINRIIYCIEEELKFNHSYEEICSKLDKNLSFKKYDRFLDDLAKKDLFNMEKGEEIVIQKQSMEDIKKLMIKIVVVSEKKEVKIKGEKSFIKDNRMYEEYKW